MESILTKKVVYVLKAFYYLEVVAAGEMKSVMDIAQAIEVPKRFLEQLFLKLRKADLLEAGRGAGGGYKLTRSMSEIGYKELMCALDGEGELPVNSSTGRFGEDAFVHAVRQKMDICMESIVLGDLITDAMRQKARAVEGGTYVYHI